MSNYQTCLAISVGLSYILWLSALSRLYSRIGVFLDFDRYGRVDYSVCSTASPETSSGIPGPTRAMDSIRVFAGECTIDYTDSNEERHERGNIVCICKPSKTGELLVGC